MKELTACPLDCYDACEIIYENETVHARKTGHTQGFLCPHLNHYEKFERITKPRYKGEEISMQEALEKLAEIVKETPKDQFLHYRGSGNFGLMQEVTDHFFASNKNILTEGSLCDGAGEAGIIEGRGSNKNMPLSQIEKSEVVIVWGRNPHTTSSHLLPLLKEKTLIVIDPVKTKIAKMADCHVQLKPHSDLFFALLLTRFLHIENSCDTEFLDEYGSDFEEFYELSQTIRIKAALDTMGLGLGDIGDILHLITDKRVAIVCGVGIQKYIDGADVMRAIDGFAAALGLFGKEGCGVAYLGNSKEGIDSPFYTQAKCVSKVNTPFDEFESVFIQGANPLSQMPDTNRVENSMFHTKNVIYFGLWENETSKRADLVIPAKTFLEKDDIRSSYSHNALLVMQKQKESEIGISEYDLTRFLCEKFDVDIKEEEEYLEHFKKFGITKISGSFEVEAREEIPYTDGFDTDSGEFEFLEEYETLQKCGEGEFHLITPKSHTSLNSQFKREKYVYLNSSHGFIEGKKVKVSSEFGEVVLEVKITPDLRDDTVLIYSGTPGVNRLTCSKHSFEGKSAIFQQTLVRLEAAEA